MDSRARSAVFSIAMLVVVALGLGTSAARAATAPVNDLRANAQVIASLPFSDAIDVSGATSDADDTAAVGPCFPGQTIATSNSVWYSYTATADTTLVVDPRASNFGASVVIAERQGSTLGRRVCTVAFGSPERTVMSIAAGVTVSILVFNAGPPGAVLDLGISVYAATVPVNDTLSGATVIPALPFSTAVDPLLATVDADDAQLSDACQWGPDTHSVWYAFTAGAKDTRVLFTTTGSFARIAIATGQPGALNPLACDQSGGVIIPTTPGTTYFVLLDAGNDPLQLSVLPAPPPPAISARFNDEGEVDRFGVAHLSGTYQCSDASFGLIFASGTETRGQVVLQGVISIADRSSGTNVLSCDGRRHAFLGTATESGGGAFRPGKMLVQFSALACAPGYPCTFSPFPSQAVELDRQER